MVGDGLHRERLRALATELAINDHVHLVGYQPVPGPFLDTSDLFALAAPVGLGSVALLEAMGRGLPAVVTNRGTR